MELSPRRRDDSGATAFVRARSAGAAAGHARRGRVLSLDPKGC